ncbi:hypothetical protein MCUN1_002170 [Malassezia cuniculi]|uniref:GRIP domain-containing protein n=1 Tax=Malassezia cuniculi TaxID=948313 RepID=A0AAF0EUE4_9BASI|nr:hypothetical protein MCUN1_002170 [Malassezia cuniculi]
MDLHSAEPRTEEAAASTPQVQDDTQIVAQDTGQNEVAAPGDAGAAPVQDDEQEAEIEADEELDIDNMDADQLRTKLRTTLERCEASESQYAALLDKVAQMRTTLGDRLRQDAEELDRREQQIDELTAQAEGLRNTISTLETELKGAANESDRLTGELDKMRASIANAPAVDSAEVARLEAQCRLYNETIEAQRVDLERWEKAYMEECAAKEGFAAEVKRIESTVKEAEEREKKSESAAAEDRRVAQQLQEALEELQLSQERDVQRTIGEMQQQVEAAEAEVESHRVRLAEMEDQCKTMSGFEPRIGVLEREIKEKNVLIDKLRHEAVILNEHLTEALRQIRRDSSDYLVDRRLVTNLFVQFLNVPHGDAKRFEILRLIGSVLHWNDEEREKAGLQRSQGGITGVLGSLVGRRRLGTTTQNVGDESVSNLFVEFLLSEADRSVPDGGMQGAPSGAESNAAESDNKPKPSS